MIIYIFNKVIINWFFSATLLARANFVCSFKDPIWSTPPLPSPQLVVIELEKGRYLFTPPSVLQDRMMCFAIIYFILEGPLFFIIPHGIMKLDTRHFAEVIVTLSETLIGPTVLSSIITQRLSPSFDPYQFAHQQGKQVNRWCYHPSVTHNVDTFGTEQQLCQAGCLIPLSQIN